MKRKISIAAVILVMACMVLTHGACNMGSGDARERNIENATLARLDSVAGVRFIGLSDTHVLEDGRFQAVVIYIAPDSVGNDTERNARVVTNNTGTEIITWEALNTQVLTDAKQKVAEKLEEKGIDLDPSLIDALIELKR